MGFILLRAGPPKNHPYKVFQAQIHSSKYIVHLFR